jgi:hypothetical protein
LHRAIQLNADQWKAQSRRLHVEQALSARVQAPPRIIRTLWTASAGRFSVPQASHPLTTPLDQVDAYETWVKTT